MIPGLCNSLGYSTVRSYYCKASYSHYFDLRDLLTSALRTHQRLNYPYIASSFWDKCDQIQSVIIYYWASEAQDTACLTTLLGLPEITLPPGLTPQIGPSLRSTRFKTKPPTSFCRTSPSIYAVLASLTESDGSSQNRSTCDTFHGIFRSAPSLDRNRFGWVVVNDFSNAPCRPPGRIPLGYPYQPPFLSKWAVWWALCAIRSKIPHSGLGDSMVQSTGLIFQILRNVAGIRERN